MSFPSPCRLFVFWCLNLSPLVAAPWHCHICLAETTTESRQIAYDSDDCPPMRLRLKNNSVGLGQILPNISNDELAWQNEGLSQPLLFELGAIRSASRSQAVRSLGGGEQDYFRVETASGEVLVGAISSLDENTLNLNTALLGELSIPRPRVKSLLRVGNSGPVIYHGLTDSSVWKILSEPEDWQFRAGSLLALKQGASIVGDVRLPAQSEITMSIAWKGVPDFVVHLGSLVSRKKTGSIPSAARLEIWNRNVVLVRETQNDADLVRLLELNENQPQLELSILLDQERGRILAHDLYGKELGEIQLASENPTIRSAIQIANHGPSLSIERLEIRHWDGNSFVTSKGSNEILLKNGRVLPATIQGLSQDQKSFVVLTESGEEDRLAVAELAFARLKSQEVETSLEESSKERQSNAATDFEIVLSDTTRLRCTWSGGDGQSIRLSSSVFNKNFDIAPQHIVGIIGNDQPYSFSLTHNQNGLLRVGHSEISGYLTKNSSQAEHPALEWRPHGSKSASPWYEDSEGQIDFAHRSFPDHWPSPKLGEPTGRLSAELKDAVSNQDDLGKPPEPDSDSDGRPPLLTRHLHFVSGDTIDGYVEKIDENGVYFQSEQTRARFVEHTRVSNLWLNSLLTSVKQPPTDKLLRLMVVPRINRNDPPTHLLLSVSGDWLRCRLVELTQEMARVEVQREMLVIPRDQIAQIVWLHHRQWAHSSGESEEEGQLSEPGLSRDSTAASAVLEKRIHVSQNERGLTLVPTSFDGEELIGLSELLGECRVSLRGVNRILFGPRLETRVLESKENPWVLRLARAPKSDSNSNDQVNSGLQSAMVGQPAPSFALDCLDGQSVQLGDLLGQVVVLDFWASWSAPCKTILPGLQELLDKLPQSRVQIVAVNVQEAESRIRETVEQLAIRLPIALDRDGAIAGRYLVNTIPQTMVIDPKGIVRYAFSGADPNYLQRVGVAIRDLLDEEAR